jgi:hypothetical protein
MSGTLARSSRRRASQTRPSGRQTGPQQQPPKADSYKPGTYTPHEHAAAENEVEMPKTVCIVLYPSRVNIFGPYFPINPFVSTIVFLLYTDYRESGVARS